MSSSSMTVSPLGVTTRRAISNPRTEPEQARGCRTRRANKHDPGLNGLADEIVSLPSHEPFYAIGLYYEDFRQVSDSEVIDILSKSRSPETTVSQT